MLAVEKDQIILVYNLHAFVISEYFVFLLLDSLV